MNKIFERYTELFRKRYEQVESTKMGEDSVRYDFFQALQQEMQLSPSDIHLEFPFDDDAYIKKTNYSTRRTRNEKPVMDLWINTQNLKLCVEFGYFRVDPVGKTNTTANGYKMINDFIRIGIHSHLNKCTGLFICVADKKNINYRIPIKNAGNSLASNYKFYHSDISNQTKIAKTAFKKTHEGFLKKLASMNLSVTAELMHSVDVATKLNPTETKILVWKVYLT